MRIFSKFVAVGVLLFSISGFSMILPPNHLNIFDGQTGPSNITEEQFNQIVDSIVAIWKPIAAKYGAQLMAVKNWKDSTVNAYAEQNGNVWTVHMFGGLARRPEITPDGFALVVCHELGHHFGGYYFYGNGEWAAAEGQADYFATQMCGRRIFQSFKRNNLFRSANAPDPVKVGCDGVWKSQAQADQCYRIAAGGYALAHLLAAAGNSPAPHFESPDQSQVQKTYTGHPKAQCRLDTYFAGALCPTNLPPDVIPGKQGNGGMNSPEAEALANKYSCSTAGGFQVGVRPRCWFKPQL